jgi:hypothetical protein
MVILSVTVANGLGSVFASLSLFSEQAKRLNAKLPVKIKESFSIFFIWFNLVLVSNLINSEQNCLDAFYKRCFFEGKSLLKAHKALYI